MIDPQRGSPEEASPGRVWERKEAPEPGGGRTRPKRQPLQLNPGRREASGLPGVPHPRRPPKPASPLRSFSGAWAHLPRGSRAPSPASPSEVRPARRPLPPGTRHRHSDRETRRQSKRDGARHVPGGGAAQRSLATAGTSAPQPITKPARARSATHTSPLGSACLFGQQQPSPT